MAGESADAIDVFEFNDDAKVVRMEGFGNELLLQSAFS
jgi:hypothetical protein